MFSRTALLTLSLTALTSSAFAQSYDFGGFEEKFKGAGDKIPPQCQINIPRAKTEAFNILWNCTDDNAGAQDIRTELWMVRKGSPSTEKVAQFLGFPAAFRVDEAALGVQNFADGLPVSFRLVAIDRAGITTVSPVYTVRAQDNSLRSCTMQISTQETESDGGRIGPPPQIVGVDSAEVQSNQPTETSVTISTLEKAEADPCEIESICQDKSKVTLQASLTLDSSDSSASGTLTVVPGSVVVDVTGSYETSGLLLSTVEVSGTTTIDAAPANVVLSCKR